MDLHAPRQTILLLLSLLIGGSALLSPVLTAGDQTLPSFFMEEELDCDDVEESSESKLVATLEPIIRLCDHTGFHAVSVEVDHQIDWLFVHEHAARAPPLG